jgi:hypothetical protein
MLSVVLVVSNWCDQGGADACTRREGYTGRVLDRDLVARRNFDMTRVATDPRLTLSSLGALVLGGMMVFL